MTPCLATLYAGMVTAASGPAIEAMLMMRPALRSRKYGVTALQVRNTDLVFTAKVRSQSSSVLLVNGMPGGDAMPALFTSTSMRPSTSRVRSTISLTSEVLVTSHFIASTLRPSAFTSSAVFSALSTWMSGIAMSAPSFAIASTMPRPMPLPPPVTIATFPSSRAMHASVDIIGAPEGHMTTHTLRSRNWFGRMDLDGFATRSWLKTEGFSEHVFDGRPVIGSANSWSELTSCSAQLRQVADAVKRGGWSAGGFPLESPTISLGEVLMKPTTMLFRNLMAMDVEECIRAYPLDSVVLLSGCDKTTPAMLMGAASADVPAIMVTGGPMLRGKWRQEELGSGTDLWRLWAERRAGRLTDELSRGTPFLLSLRPSGKYLMEDFFYAGGLPVVLKELLPLLHAEAPTVNGRSLADNVRDARCWNDDVIRPLGVPLAPEGGLAILTGNLCPDGAVIKVSAASPQLLTHRGRAVVFEDHADLHARIDDPSLKIDETSVLVLKHVGPKGAPGMPEWGAAPVPARLLQRGVKDMVRISDARMSGTSYGTVVLHVAPESAVGGPLALVRDGDEIELDVPRRTLTLRVGDEELAKRKAAWKARPPHFSRGYGRLFLDHVLQANDGCDFDYLRGRTPVRFEDSAGPSHA